MFRCRCGEVLLDLGERRGRPAWVCPGVHCREGRPVIEFTCPDCGSELSVAEDLGGRSVLCRECSTRVKVPDERKRLPPPPPLPDPPDDDSDPPGPPDTPSVVRPGLVPAVVPAALWGLWSLGALWTLAAYWRAFAYYDGHPAVITALGVDAALSAGIPFGVVLAVDRIFAAFRPR